MAFRIAASLAFKEAARKATPIVLEPVMMVVFTVSESRLGAMMAEISARRGRVTNVNSLRGAATVLASIPLAEVLSGVEPAPTTMEFQRFEPVTPGRGADPTGSAIRNPRAPKPRTGSAAADPNLD